MIESLTRRSLLLGETFIFNSRQFQKMTICPENDTHILASYRTSRMFAENECEKKRQHGACIVTDGPKEEWEQANRAAWIRNEANLPLGMFPITFTSLLSSPPRLPSRAGVWLHRDVGRPVRRKEMHLLRETRVAGRRSLKSENNKIHLTPPCFTGPRFPRNEDNS